MKETNGMVEDKKVTAPHGIVLENRRSLHISGVTDVGEFDEQTVQTVTSQGGLMIRGRALHISRLDLENGDLWLDGEIHALQYTEAIHKGKGSFSRFFR